VKEATEDALIEAHDAPPLLLKKARPMCTAARSRKPSADEATPLMWPAL
jgi:hypothetical protein